MISCQNKAIKLTPTEFKSDVRASEELYSKDSISLVKLIKEEIKEHKGSYYPKPYDENTQIIIDTIMYSSDYNKLTFFIIDRKENKKIYPDNFTKKEVNELIKDGHTKIPYDGHHFLGKAYIGIRKNSDLLINNYFRISTPHYNEMKEAKERLRESFFKEYSAIKHKGYEYNLDDKRFWDKKIWNFDK